MRIFHVSDLHFHRAAAANSGAVRALAAIRAAFDDESILMVTGDVTDDGHPEQYAHALEALKPFAGTPDRPQLVICPGNHDFGAAGNFYERARAVRFDEILCKGLGQPGFFVGDQGPVVRVVSDGQQSIMFIALDSNLETVHPFDFACGQIGRNQLRRLDQLLSDRSTQAMRRVLLLHHHPFEHDNPFMELRDARALWRTIYGRVDVLAFGHKHVMGKWTDRNGIPLTVASDSTPGKDFARLLQLPPGGKPVAVDFKLQ